MGVEEGLRPLFLLSPPRSGSTLLQRLLATHREIATVSEPWLLLPVVYSLRDTGVLAEYGHRRSVEAIHDFCRALPAGTTTYLSELASAARRMYALAARDGAKYFLDKTPRYGLIANELFSMFPDAAFVFLWRNPLAIVASIIETWGGSKWNLGRFEIDLYRVVDGLVEAYRSHESSVFALQYERLVEDPQGECERVFDFLQLEPPKNVLTRLADVSLDGRMGDTMGLDAYGNSVTRDSLSKWQTVLSNPVRRRWCSRYLGWLGPDRLEAMGYSPEAMLSELRGGPRTRDRAVSDVVRRAWESTVRRSNGALRDGAGRRVALIWSKGRPPDREV
jgi:hypothetical protein